MWWLPEWPDLTGEFERMECQRCRSLDADIASLQTQLHQAHLCIRASEQTIEQLRQDKAALECNRDLRMDRPAGWDTSNSGES